MFRPFGSSSAPLPRSAHAPHKHANKPYEPLPSLLANPKHDAALSTRESKLRELTVRLSTRQGGRASTAYLDASKPITIKKVDPNLLTIQAVLSLRLLVRKWRGRRKRTRAGLFSYALNNGALAPPKPLYQWSSHWEHCAKCERCTTDVYDKDRAFFCGHCNVTVCHDCLTRDERGRRAYNRARGFREPPCQWCISEHEQQRQLYQNDKEAMWTDSVYRRGASTLSAKVRAWVTRKRFRELIKNLVLVQSVCRRNKARGRFRQNYRAATRPLRVVLRRAESVPDVAMHREVRVFVTILDYATDRQIFRFETMPRLMSGAGGVQWEEVIFVPACTFSSTVVVTLYQRRVQDPLAILLGQATLPLRSTPIAAMEKGIIKRGFETELQLGTMKHVPRADGSDVPFRPTKPRIGKGGGKPLLADPPAKGLARYGGDRGGKITIAIQPFASIVAVCGELIGPTLENMRRREHAIMLQCNSKAGRRHRWFAVAAAGKLRLYLHKGDAVPKWEINLKKTFLTLPVWKETAALGTEDWFSLELPNKGAWLFELELRRAEYRHWVFVLEYWRRSEMLSDLVQEFGRK